MLWWGLVVDQSFPLRVNLLVLWTLAHLCHNLVNIVATKRGNLVVRQDMLDPLHLFSIVVALLLHLKSLYSHLPDLSLLFKKLLFIFGFELLDIMLNWHVSILQVIIVFFKMRNLSIFLMDKILQKLILLLKSSYSVTIEVQLVLGIDYLIIYVLGLIL